MVVAAAAVAISSRCVRVYLYIHTQHWDIIAIHHRNLWARTHANCSTPSPTGRDFGQKKTGFAWWRMTYWCLIDGQMTQKFDGWEWPQFWDGFRSASGCMDGHFPCSQSMKTAVVNVLVNCHRRIAGLQLGLQQWLPHQYNYQLTLMKLRKRIMNQSPLYC